MKKDTLTDEKENEREEKIKEEHVCKFIWITPDEKDYGEYVKFGEINNHICESNKKLTKKYLKNFSLTKFQRGY